MNIKRINTLFLCVFLQLLFVANAFSQAWDGTTKDTDWYVGHEYEPSYTISTAEELAGLSQLVSEGIEDFSGKTINIGSDPMSPVTIDLGSYVWTSIGNSTNQFSGSVNGNNCTIKNFTTSGQYVGLFGYVKSKLDIDDDILIQDINVETNVSGTSYVAGLCGYLGGFSTSKANAKIQHCTFNGNVNATTVDKSYAGGIVGYLSCAKIAKCAVAGQVSSYNYVGGIVGYSGGSTARSYVQYCVNNAIVKGANIYVGGIVGYSKYTNIYYDANAGNVYGPSRLTGGILGYNGSNTKLNYCLNTGMVNNGGAISGNAANEMKYCYYDKQRTATKGIAATDGSSADASGKAVGLLTSEMAGATPSGISGDNWTNTYWIYNSDLYPIPVGLETSDFGTLSAAPVYINTAEQFNNVVEDITLCSGYAVAWTSSNTTFASVEGNTVTINGNGHADLTATFNGLSKVVTIENVSLTDPLTIDNLQDLIDFRDAVNGVADNYKGAVSYSGFSEYNFQLTADIDMSSVDNWIPIGDGTSHPFSGNFDGNGYTISGMTVTRNVAYSGLFGYVYIGTIKDITVKGNVTGTTYDGGICGYLKSSTTSKYASLTNCHFIGNVSTTNASGSVYVGGVCACSYSYAKIIGCSATGMVNATAKGVNYVGGIVGNAVGSSATNHHYLNNNINLADVAGASYVGGIVGYIYQYTDVTNNLNAGNVNGTSATSSGGIIGYNKNTYASNIQYNISTGTTSFGSSVIGTHNATANAIDPEYNYYDNQRSILGGIAGADAENQAEGKLTAELLALDLTGWTATDGYPVPSLFTNANVIAVAKAPANFANSETYNVLASDFALGTSDGVAWTSDNTEIISIAGANATVSGIYGVVTLTAAKGEISKTVPVSVAVNEDPLTISTYEEFQMFRDAVNAGADGQYKGHANVKGFTGVNFKVTADIDMTDPDDNPWVPVGTSTNPFRGNFDGDNHNLTNISVSKASNYAGLFGYAYPANGTATIKNINLSGNVVNTKSYTGGIIGYAKGYSATSMIKIQNCHFNGALTSSSYAGGICGGLGAYAIVSDCSSAGLKITSSSTNVGGIVGSSAGNATTMNEITGCVSISKNLRGTGNVGGIVGTATNTNIMYNVNAAIVNSTNDVVGGIAGNVGSGASLVECLNFITVNNLGKIYGTNSGTVTNCYYDSQFCALGEDNGTGKTTAEMKSLSLTADKWITSSDMYPIPANLETNPTAIVASTPITLAGSETNQTVETSFTVYSPTDLVWSSPDDGGFITIEANGVDVTVNTEFSRVILTATLGNTSKDVYLVNENYNPNLTIDSYEDLVALKTAVNAGPSGIYKDVYNVDGYAGKTFTVTADINMTENWTYIGSSTYPFKGEVIGQGYTISGLKSASASVRGLFGYIENATISDLNVTTGTGTLTGTSYVGGIAAVATKSTITGCTFNGNIKASSTYAGGIVAKMVSSTVENCAVSGNLTSTNNYAGGISGHISMGDAASEILSCTSNMNIVGLSSVGGIAGYNSNSIIKFCNNAGNVTGNTENVGGVAGYNTDNEALVAYNFNSGTVNMGGAVIGYQHPDATATANFFDKQRTELSGICHVGEGDGTDTNAEGKYTTELVGNSLQSSLSTGWSFSSGMYPIPTTMVSVSQSKLAAVPVFLANNEIYNQVASDFTLGTIDGLVWTVITSNMGGSSDPYVTINGTTAEVDNENNSATLTATYEGYTKTVQVYNPSSEDPLLIENYTQLNAFRTAVNAGSTGSYKGVPNVGGFTGKNFKLTDDIALSSWGSTAIGKSSAYPFNGNFDGDNHTISDLNITGNSDYHGLFGYVIGAKITNLNVAGKVVGKSYVGGICAYIKGDNSSNYAEISNCTFNGTITSSASYAGGIVGKNDQYSKVLNCMVAGSVRATTSYAGGITGYSYSSSTTNIDTVSNCTNAATVTSASYVGGIAGRNYYSRIEYCNNGGNVSGQDYNTGGITGNNYASSQLAYCLNTSLVDNGGAVVGYDQGTSTNNYYDNQRTTVKGRSATDGSSADVTAKAVGLQTSAMIGETPTALEGTNWTEAYWTFAEGLYPAPKKVATSDFAIVASTPIFLNETDTWETVTADFTLGNPTGTTWASSNTDFITVSSYDATIMTNENNSTILTSTLNGISKKYTLCNYGAISELTIENLAELKDFRDAVNNRGEGSYKGILNMNGFRGIDFKFDEDHSETFDLSAETWVPIGKDANNSFTGNFIGNGNTISNLKITASASYAGLFGHVKDGNISDLTISNPTISNSGSYTGAICGTIVGASTSKLATITNCQVVGGTIKSTASNSYLGGVVGTAGNFSRIEDCTNSAVITSRNYTGGIAGSAGSYAALVDCENTADISGRSYTGGICGTSVFANYNADNIVNCENSGNVTAGDAYSYVGGIVGNLQTAGNVTSCVNTGNVKGGNYVGGIAGYLLGSNDYSYIGTISNCINDSTVKALNTSDYSYAGGICGRMGVFTKVKTSSNSGNVTGPMNYVGGIAGSSYASNDIKQNTITLSTNSAVVTGADFVGGICGRDTLTTVSYNNNGGNVMATDGDVCGGISGCNKENSVLMYNINTGTVESASGKASGICAENAGTVTNNYYDNQRSGADLGIATADVADCAEGKPTADISGTTPSALTGADWATNFVFAADMYPIPGGTETFAEAILAATPIFLSTDAEVYDSVLNDFTLASCESWISNVQADTIVIEGNDVTVNRICNAKVPVVLTASIDGLDKLVTLKLASKADLLIAPISDQNICLGTPVDINVTEIDGATYEWRIGNDEEIPDPVISETNTANITPMVTTQYSIKVSLNGCDSIVKANVIVAAPDPDLVGDYETYLWIGAVDNDWNTPGNWLAFDGENFSTTTAVPSLETNAVIADFEISEDESCFTSNVLSTNDVIKVKNLTVGEGMTFDLGSLPLTIAGDVYNDGTINVAESDVKFVGWGDEESWNEQYIEGNSGITFNNVAFINESGILFYSAQEPIVTGVATIGQDGQVEISGNITFAEGSSYTISDGSYIDGRVTKIGDDPFTFPIGNGGDRSFFSATPTESAIISVGHSYDVDDMPDYWEHGGNMGSGENKLDHVTDAENWKVASDKPLKDITLYWSAGDHGIDEGENLNALRVAFASVGGSNWTNAGGVVAEGSDHNGGSIFVEGPIPFGGTRALDEKFVTFASTDPKELKLPINLVDFTASCNDNSVVVEWSTLSEKNNDFFVLEKSYDAQNFIVVTTVAGAGNSIDRNDYSFTDYEYYGGEVYYRLLQVDFDGTKSMSEIISVRCRDNEADANVAVYPNPFNSNVTVALSNFNNQPLTIEIYNVMGELVRMINVDSPMNDYEMNIDLSDLSAASYTMRVRTADIVINRRIVKQ